MTKHAHKIWTVVLPLWLSLGGCLGPLDQGKAGDAEEYGAADREQTSAALSAPAKAPNVEVAFTTFEDPAGIGRAGEAPTKLTIRSAARYKETFGHAAPADINFTQGDVVIFYSAGRKPTLGFSALVTKVERRGFTYYVSTQLDSPGLSCDPLPARSLPYVLARFAAPAFASSALFGPTAQRTVECDEPEAEDLSCGGIAAFPCEGAAQCVDNPDDDCDPAQGGADCGGICQCKSRQECRNGQVWDGSADVCACVRNPCALTLCPLTSRCEVIEGEAVCVPHSETDPCADKICPAGSRCYVTSDQPICAH